MSILDEIFNKIQQSQTPTTQALPKNENLFKAETGKTYVVRFLPYMPNPYNTMIEFKNHGWESRQTGRYISVPCLKSWGKSEVCPCCETRFAELKIGTEAAKNKARLLRQKTMHFANIYIIESPNESEIGQVKIWRYGAEINKIVQSAIVGEDAEEYGKRIFDLSTNGIDFRIRAEMKGTGREATPTYVSSKFVTKPRDLGLSASEIQGIYDRAHDLTTMLPPKKTADELQKVLNEHYFTKAEGASAIPQYVSEPDDEDEIPTPTTATPTIHNAAISDIDDAVNDILKEFEIPNI